MSVLEVCQKAKDNAQEIAFKSQAQMNQMLKACAAALKENTSYIISQNQIDIGNCNKPENIIDRLRLTPERINGMALGLEKLVELNCPVGEVLDQYSVENGLNIKKVRVPLGVVGIIYEARPNVTADAIGLAIKSGNAIVLRGSGDAILSNIAITSVIKNAIKSLGFNAEFIQLITQTDRASALDFMRMKGIIDVLIPRGGAGLIASAVENATVPVIQTGTGNCHIYVEKTADLVMAESIIINAKTQRNSVCNAAESLVIDIDILEKFLPQIFIKLSQHNVTVVGDSNCIKVCPQILPATEQDYFEEFLGPKISVLSSIDYKHAVSLVNKYSTGHSESIISSDVLAQDYFTNVVNSAAVYVNTSTRFTDGFEFGLGAEMGISTQKLHARGPMGLKELTSYKYIVTSNGLIRK